MNAIEKIREERAKIAQQRAALEKRDAELAVAERVVADFEGLSVPEPTGVIAHSIRRTEAFQPSRRDKVLEALGGEKVWMTSREINFEIAKRHVFPIKGSSFHPLLTSLKNEGVLVRDGDKLALASRIEQEEAI